MRRHTHMHSCLGGLCCWGAVICKLPTIKGGGFAACGEQPIMTVLAPCTCCYIIQYGIHVLLFTVCIAVAVAGS